MRVRSTRPVAGMLLSCLLLALLPIAARAGSAPAVDVPRLDVLGTDALAHVTAPVLRLGDSLRPKASAIRIALLGSGVDAATLPSELRDRVTHPWGAGDLEGYGTYAASVLLQLIDEPRITSFNVFTRGSIDPGKLNQALDWSKRNATKLDAVLLAASPHTYLDPVSAAMEAGDWRELLDVMGDHPTATTDGTVFGIDLDAGRRRAAMSGATPREVGLADRFAASVSRWHQTRALVGALTASGVPVVAPAGDLGPEVQTIFGVANLPEVITVGAGTERAIATSSSSGPGMDGSVKPDLVAPAGIVGVLPPGSALARSLEAGGALDAGLQPVWDAPEPVSEARARLETSLTSAALTAAAAGGLAAEGLEDTAVVRGALVAASVPVSGEPVWRQGAGVLRGVPDAGFARSRSLALGHADLGAEPDEGEWSTFVPFTDGVSKAASALGSFAGVGPDGATVTETVKPSSAPEPSVGVSNEGVRVAAPLGDSRYQGGLYCGYTQVQVPASGGASADPSLSIAGVPSGVEQLPTCLVKGSRVRGFGFYIHDAPAEDLTFALLPGIPEEASLLHRPFMILPVDPLKTKLYVKVTDADGFADFPNVVPGYYTVRQFSDYGSPITQTLTDPETGGAVVRASDIGHNPSYQDFDALILGAAGITEADLRSTFGEDNVKADPPTQGWFVTAGPRTFRVVLDRFKKMPGPAVASRVVDLMGYGDLEFNALKATNVLNLPQLRNALVAGDLRTWTFAQGGHDPAGVSALFNPALATSAQSKVLGVAHYPFSLTTPNYTMNLSLNFSYEVTNAAIIAVVQAGETIASGVVTPHGTMRTPTLGTTVPVGTNGVAVSGQASGLANFEFALKPLGASEGNLYLIFVPSRPVQELAAPVSSVSIGDLSMAYDTWQRTLWPATQTPFGMGHSFSVQPNYSPRQMSSDACRTVDSGGVSARVCEDWVVMVHSAGDDAATMDVVSTSGSTVDAMASGRTAYADPRRGTSDFSLALGFVLPGAGVPADVALDVDNPFRTNGRFWEQLALSRDVLAAHPGSLLVQIKDNEPGRSSPLAPHLTGGVPVAPYVPFANDAVVVDPYRLTLQDTDGLPSVAPPPDAAATTVALSSAGTAPAQTQTAAAPVVASVRRESEKALKGVRLKR